MRGKEIITLDAEIVSVINTRAFRARLKNGHEFTAYWPEDKNPPPKPCAPGMRVYVVMSPFDMSCGELTDLCEIEARR